MLLRPWYGPWTSEWLRPRLRWRCYWLLCGCWCALHLRSSGLLGDNTRHQMRLILGCLPCRMLLGWCQGCRVLCWHEEPCSRPWPGCRQGCLEGSPGQLLVCTSPTWSPLNLYHQHGDWWPRIKRGLGAGWVGQGESVVGVFTDDTMCSESHLSGCRLPSSWHLGLGRDGAGGWHLLQFAGWAAVGRPAAAAARWCAGSSLRSVGSPQRSTATRRGRSRGRAAAIALSADAGNRGALHTE